MRKLIVTAVAIMVAFGFAVAVNAEEKVDVKTKELKSGAQETTVKTKGQEGKMEIKAVSKGQETDVKAKAEGKKEKVQVSEKREKGEIKEATVSKEARGTNPVLKKTVKYHSMSKDGTYITVIERGEKIRYPTKNPKRPYAIKHVEKEPIEITASYDINKGQYVVDRALIQKASTPMKDISQEQVQKALTKDAPPQPKEQAK